MGLVQCLLIFLLLPAQLVHSFPTAMTNQYDPENNEECPLCPAGTYQSSCTECKPCPAGTFTTELNQEERCDRCSADCRPDFNLKVVQNCTSKSDIKCICEAGFTCTVIVPLSENCRYCEKIQEVTTAGATPTILVKDERTSPSASTRHSSTSAKPCQFSTCGPKSSPAAGKGTHSQTEKNSPLVVILVFLLVCIGSAALVILFLVRRPADKPSFKQAIAWLLCSKGGRESSLKSKDSTHQPPRDSSSAKQPPSSLSAANLGPVHFHNPGTVIFSLLSQFTGQVGPTVEGGKSSERGKCEEEEEEEEEERDCPVFHPTSSPTIHFSEEERSSETDSIFFPSQEQGKDCHVSKEEVL